MLLFGIFKFDIKFAMYWLMTTNLEYGERPQIWNIRNTKLGISNEMTRRDL